MMILRFARFALLSTVIVLASTRCEAQTGAATLTIDPAQIVHPVSPTLYGLMTEEINHSYEGGLYAEMVSNRTLRWSWSGAEGWMLVQRGNASAAIESDKTTGPSAALPYSLRLTVDAATPKDAAGIANNGWWGMAVRPHTAYRGSFYAKVRTMWGR